MAEVIINYFAVLVSAVVGFGIGMLWFSPVLFGNIWMKQMNLSKEKIEEAKKKGMAKNLVVAFASVLVMSYILAHFVDYASATTILGGMQAGFWIWLGFIATTMVNSVLWEQKPVNLYLINIAHYLVVLLAMGSILAVWL